MSLTNIDTSSDIPYRLTLISPGYYLHTELNHDEYTRNVMNRGQHMHNTFEIVYTREGEFYQQIEAKRYRYTARSCCVLNPNIRHREEYTGRFSIITLSLDHDFVETIINDPLVRFFPASVDFNRGSSEEMLDFFSFDPEGDRRSSKHYLNFAPAYEFNADNDRVHDIFDELAMHMLSPGPGSAFTFKALVCQLLSALCDKKRYTTQLVELGTETESRIFSSVTALLEENHGRLSRAELSRRLNYSGSYISRIVNKYSGRSISEYGNFFAMQQAARLLNSTDISITDIAAQLGFTDRTYFYKLFHEEYGMTPKQFRKEKERL